MMRPVRLGWVPDAKTLMRSRYSAYVLGLETYLKASWHPNTRPAMLELAIKSRRPLDDQHATVEFLARYKLNAAHSNCTR